ncbi:MAG: hypothetical protein K1000chlam2_00087 [Chlamydiae bacterium]|nr:hypothetical protein [Chlamydiota bacterium]
METLPHTWITQVATHFSSMLSALLTYYVSLVAKVLPPWLLLSNLVSKQLANA